MIGLQKLVDGRVRFTIANPKTYVRFTEVALMQH
jgi:hypothetical protein